MRRPLEIPNYEAERPTYAKAGDWDRMVLLARARNRLQRRGVATRFAQAEFDVDSEEWRLVAPCGSFERIDVR